MEICVAAASSTPLTEYNHRRFQPSLPLDNNNNNNKSPLSGAAYPCGFDRRVTPLRLRLRLKLQLRVTATATADDDDDTTNFTQQSTHDISTLNNNASSTYNHSTLQQQQQQQQQQLSSDNDDESLSLSDESAQPFQDFVDDLRFKLDSEDSYVLFLYGGGSLVAVWLLAAIVGAIDALPVLPKLMEVVGLGYSLWFTTRYLLFKKNRKELSAKIEELKREVLGSDDD